MKPTPRGGGALLPVALSLLVLLGSACSSLAAVRQEIESRVDPIAAEVLEHKETLEAVQTHARAWLPSPWGEAAAGLIALALAAAEAQRQRKKAVTEAAAKVHSERDQRRAQRGEPTLVPGPGDVAEPRGTVGFREPGGAS